MQCQLNQTQSTTSRRGFSLRKTLSESLKFLKIPFESGKRKDESKLCVPEEKEHIDDITSKTFYENKSAEFLLSKNQLNEKTLFTPECPLETNQKISKDKSNSSTANSLITRLCRILEAGLTSKEKDLSTFWNQQSAEYSKQLWLPTETDSVVLDSNSLNDCSNAFPMQKSWFSTTVSVPQTKSWQKTFLQSLPSSLQELTDGKDTRDPPKKKHPVHSKKQTQENKGDIQEETKEENNEPIKEENLITMKIRLFPTDEEKRWIKVAEGDSRWYYNRALECIKGIQVMNHDKEIDERKNPGEIFSKDSSELQQTPLFQYYLARKALKELRVKGAQCVYRFSRGRQKGERCDGLCEKDKFFCLPHKAYEDKFMKRVKTPLKVEQVRKFLTHVVMDEWVVHQDDEPTELKHCVHSEWSYSYDASVSNTHIESPEDVKRIRGNGKTPTTEVAQRFRYGVLENLVRDLKSAMANGRNDLVYRLKSKKDKHQLVSADGWLDTRTKTMFPKVLKNIKGRFKVGKKPIDLQQLISRIGEDNENRSYTILHDKEQARYFLLVPVSHNWFSAFKTHIKRIPCENQTLNERFPVASLDPGVYPAQCLYGLNHTVDIGTNSAEILHSLLLKEDELHSLIQQKIHIGINRRKIKRLRQRIKNLVSEQHWKTCSFLTNNYESILLPEYKISEMMKGKKLSKRTKRQMQVLSPTTFKNRLINKCKQKDVFICICSEVYTSKTCGSCGVVNKKLKGEKEWVCPTCDIRLQRDPNSARLILIKNCFS